MKKKNSIRKFNIPAGIIALLFLFSLIIFLTPYLSGRDIVIIKIPSIGNNIVNALKFSGPLILLFFIFLFLPLWAGTEKSSECDPPKNNDSINPPAPTAISRKADDKLFFETIIDVNSKSDASGSGYEKEEVPSVLKINIKPEYIVNAVTDNSVYKIGCSKKAGYYIVSGGWFSKKGKPGYEVKILGCLKNADDKSAEEIYKGYIASCDMCIKFGNGVVTSPVKKITLWKPII